MVHGWLASVQPVPVQGRSHDLNNRLDRWSVLDDGLLGDSDSLFDDLGLTQNDAGATARARSGRIPMLLGVGSLACAAVALVMGVVVESGQAGWVVVAAGVAAYLLALGADLLLRQTMRDQRNYNRPRLCAVLRIVVVWAAVGAAWLSTSGYAVL